MASRRVLGPLRWVFLGVAVVVLVAFLFAQRQSADVTYGRSSSTGDIPGTADAGTGLVSVPSVERMTAMLEAEPVVRLPGAIAYWDERRVDAIIGDHDVRILVAPPGLDEEEADRVRAVENATARVVGTRVTGGFYEATADSLPGWRAQFGAGDITGALVTLLAALTDQEPPPDVDQWRWREPDEAELALVVTDLRTTGLHTAPGATLTGAPPAAAAAFPGDDPLFVALPAQPGGEPAPEYGPALAAEFPDTPIIIQYGSWIEYHGPRRDEFAELAAVSFYSQFAGPLSRSAYPQDNVLAAYLGRVADIRHAGLFDRPLPYQPFDPLRVALPVLPWLFAACVVGFLVLSLRALPGATARPRRPRLRRPAAPGPSAELAGLSALAVEMSLLTDRRSDPALARGIGKLQAARTALADALPERHVSTLVDDARSELDAAARTMGLAFFRPRNYLRGWLS